VLALRLPYLERCSSLTCFLALNLCLCDRQQQSRSQSSFPFPARSRPPCTSPSQESSPRTLCHSQRAKQFDLAKQATRSFLLFDCSPVFYMHRNGWAWLPLSGFESQQPPLDNNSNVTPSPCFVVLPVSLPRPYSKI